MILSGFSGKFATPRGRHARTKMSLQSMGGRSLAFLTRCQLRFCRHPVRAAMLMLVAVSLMCLYTFLFPVNPDGFVTHVRASGQNLSSTKPTDKLAKRFNPTAKEDKDKRSIILKTKGQNYFTGSKEEIDSTVTQGLDFSSKRKDNLRNTTLNKIRLRSVLLLLKGGRQTVAPLQSISSKPSGTFTAKLKSSSWKRITHTTSTTVRPPTDAELRVFRRRVNDSELQIFGKLLDAFSATLTQARIPFFLYGGTLIGSWRHHGPIPWDDDADVAIPFAKRRRVQELLATIGPDFMVRTRGNQTTKFYHHDSSKAGGQMWRWPFIDVCFYVENATHIWDPDKYFPEYHFPKEIVFPLTQRPYMGRMLPTPKDTKAFLTHTYNIDKCLVGHYSHRIEHGRPDSDRGHPVDCRVLHSVYPFVHRVNVEGAGCNETLVDHGAVVSWYLAANVTCQE